MRFRSDFVKLLLMLEDDINYALRKNSIDEAEKAHCIIPTLWKVYSTLWMRSFDSFLKK